MLARYTYESRGRKVAELDRINKVRVAFMQSETTERTLWRRGGGPSTARARAPNMFICRPSTRRKHEGGTDTQKRSGEREAPLTDHINHV